MREREPPPPGDREDGSGTGDDGPVASDWPTGLAERSAWPLVAALGVAGLYGGAALTLLATRRSGAGGVHPLVGWSGALLAVGAAGWLVQGRSRSTAPSDDRRGLGTAALTAALFVATETATFGAGLAYYLGIRVRPWPPGPLPDARPALVAVLTGLLVASGVTIHAARRAQRRGEPEALDRCLAATALLGLAFLAGQAVEYREVAASGAALASNPYADAFFGLTGLHGLHVLAGVLALGLLRLERAVAADPPARPAALTAVELYWHFVDAVWLVLVAALYVGAFAPVP